MSDYSTRQERGGASISTALLLTFGGLFAGMTACLCASTLVIALTSSAGLFETINALRSTGGGHIAVGARETGAIWGYDEIHEWEFEGEAGQRVVIEVLADNYSDPRVRLIGPNGALLGENDDHFGGLSSYLSVTLPSDGTYTIQIEMLSLGGYTLTLD